MAQRLSGGPEDNYRTTSHAEEVKFLRYLAETADRESEVIAFRLAADLLESHDQTAISLDDWPTARRFVELRLGQDILPNFI